jgi:hypothetical protein
MVEDRSLVVRHSERRVCTVRRARLTLSKLSAARAVVLIDVVPVAVISSSVSRTLMGENGETVAVYSHILLPVTTGDAVSVAWY